ncbi:hypothetical protein [Candidatus Poriferisocius sp.]|uniref:hypothetical protein n=1 Tax=Candidatus Poriferisocius sp. TaxID=3101276 RepID=UPI003B020B25
MDKTTIRVDVETRNRLAEMGRDTGSTIGETVREAAEALWRMRFACESMEKLEALRQDPDEWADYLAEAESTYVDDGIG